MIKKQKQGYKFLTTNKVNCEAPKGFSSFPFKGWMWDTRKSLISTHQRKFDNVKLV
jgi:hypothetical protein